MAEILSRRNEYEEIRKVFRCYDNDDNGRITPKNLAECATVLHMDHEMNDHEMHNQYRIAEACLRMLGLRM